MICETWYRTQTEVFRAVRMHVCACMCLCVCVYLFLLHDASLLREGWDSSHQSRACPSWRVICIPTCATTPGMAWLRWGCDWEGWPQQYIRNPHHYRNLEQDCLRSQRVTNSNSHYLSQACNMLGIVLSS